MMQRLFHRYISKLFCSFSINFYRFATPRGASADLFRVLVYVHTNIQVPKIPAAVLTVGRVQEDSI